MRPYILPTFLIILEILYFIYILARNVAITVELIAPIAMEEGLRFAIREGGRTVGAGVVSSIIA